MSKQKNSWSLHSPKFDYIENLNDYNLPWTGHTFFAYDLIRNLEPKTVVELGTFKGTSFYSMCQAVKDAKLPTQLFAVDVWSGDLNTGNYGDDVYELVRSTLRKYYRDVKSRMLKMTFDEALVEVADDSVDVLHIDGLHTYDAVKHDYDTWKLKVKRDGVIMFHDISIADYDVWRVWEDAKKENPKALAIEFKHSAGLGVLIRNERIIELLKDSNLDDFTNYYESKAEAHRYMLEKINFWEEKYHEARDKYKKTLEGADKINAELKQLKSGRPSKIGKIARKMKL